MKKIDKQLFDECCKRNLSADKVVELIHNGANPNANFDKHTTIYEAVSFMCDSDKSNEWFYEVTKLLLENGLNNYGGDCTDKNYTDYHALTCVSAGSDEWIVKAYVLFLEKSCNDMDFLQAFADILLCDLSIARMTPAYEKHTLECLYWTKAYIWRYETEHGIEEHPNLFDRGQYTIDAQFGEADDSLFGLFYELTVYIIDKSEGQQYRLSMSDDINDTVESV